MEKIKLGLKLSESVWNYLKRVGIQPRLNSSNSLDCCFSSEELAKVKSITLTDIKEGVKGISHLKNLENLTIQTTQRTAYTNPHDLCSITNEDIFEIEQLTKLKHLEITNQRNITSINISHLTNLSTLVLRQNENLASIVGISENRSLNSLTMFDLNSLTRIRAFDRFIEENSNLEELNLDILMYPWAIGYNPANGEFNTKALEQINNMPNESKWHETLLMKRDIVINNYQMGEMHKIALGVIDTCCPTSTSKLDTVAIVDKWLSRNVKYNHGALGTKLRTEKADNGLFVGPVGGANSSYNAFKYHSCVCAGYARAMQYLLGLRNIKTSYVSCIMGKDEYKLSEPESESPDTRIQLPKTGYHAICRVGRNYYCDPCRNASRYQKKNDNTSKFFMLTKQEARKYYALSYTEQSVPDGEPYPKSILNDAKDYAESVINELNEQNINIDTIE